LKNFSQKSNLIIALIYSSILVIGALVNPLFIPIAIFHAASVVFVYYFGSKIQDVALNVGYIWLSKWALFIVSLLITGTYAPDIFIHAMMLFVLFNVSINPASFMLNKKTF
tara:strand:+ start:300 stop:632 length:333 start_codon:yes stop_codon:yes gene_type:complete